MSKLEAMSPLGAISYAEQRLSDADLAAEQPRQRGYRSRKVLLDAARRAYALFQHQSCPFCRSEMDGEFKVYYRRREQALSRRAAVWQRVIAVQVHCGACGHITHQLIGSGEERSFLPAGLGVPREVATITRIQ